MITRCQLMNPSRPENEDPDAERLEEFAKLNKGGKLNIIKHLMRNAGNLANALQNTRPDIADAIDAIRNGNTMSLKKMENKYLYGVTKEEIIEFDSSTGKYSIRFFINFSEVFTNIDPIKLRIRRDGKPEYTLME